MLESILPAGALRQIFSSHALIGEAMYNTDPVISPRALQIQQQTAEVLSLFGEGLSGPNCNESDEGYARRCLAAVQRHSPRYRYSNFDSQPLAILDSTTAPMVRADVKAEFEKPSGPLRPRVELDPTGRKITRFYGDACECWGPFLPPPRYAKFDTAMWTGAAASRFVRA
jgi:hypothetical protein